MSMTSLWVAHQEIARQKFEENKLNQKIRNRIAKASAIGSLRKELVSAYRINPGKKPSLEDSINSLNNLFKEVKEEHEILMPQTRIIQIDENTSPSFVRNTIIGFKDYLDNIVEYSQKIREFNYKQDNYQGKLPALTAILYNLKNFASTISKQISLYLNKKNPTALEQTKILHFIDSSLEQITRKYRREIGRIIPESGKIYY